MRSPALQALRAVVRADAELSRTIARRAGLSPSEITALEALSRGPRGPAELARLLNVTTAAAQIGRAACRGRGPRAAAERTATTEKRDATTARSACPG